VSNLVPAAVIQSRLVVGQGPAGPRGPAGPPGTEGGLATYPAAVAISGHTATALTADAEVVPADCMTLAHMLSVIGVTVGAAAAGADASVQRGGVIEHNGWSFVAGVPVVVGSAGALVQAVPVGAAWTQTLGLALSPTRLLIDLQPPVLLSP